MATKAKANAWDVAEAFVSEHAEQLRGAESSEQIVELIRSAEVMKKARGVWPKILTELDKQLDIDFPGMRTREHNERVEQITAATAGQAVLHLFTAGDAEANSFAICDNEGAVLWYSEFFESERLPEDNPEAGAAMLALEKAIYLAGQVRDKTGLDGLALVAHHAHPQPNGLERLARKASANGVLVRFAHEGEDNPAVEWCRENGYRSWREVKLRDLLATAQHDDEAPAPASESPNSDDANEAVA